MSDVIKTRPILFTGEMVRAILDGRKTQTRRIIKNLQHEGAVLSPREFVEEPGKWLYNGHEFKCPHGKIGDGLWVRERCRAEELESGTDGVRYDADDHFQAIENTQEASDRWGDLWRYGKGKGRSVPSIHMPRWASRITLEITDVRVERLNDISEADAMAEGCTPLDSTGFNGTERHLLDCPFLDDSRPYANQFALLWESINGDESWAANPWTWAISFDRVVEA